MNWIIIIGLAFIIVSEFFRLEIKKFVWLKITKAYTSVLVFVLLGFNFTQRISIFLSVIFISFLIFLIIRNVLAFLKSYKYADYIENLHIAIVNVLQIVIAYAAIYQIIYIYCPDSFKYININSGSIDQYFNFIYFSVVTFATVGYGDIIPNSIISKTVVISEIILFYVYITIAVSFVSKRKMKKKKPALKE